MSAPFPPIFYIFQILKMYFSFFPPFVRALDRLLISRDNSGIDPFSRFMARLENMVDDLKAYLLRIKHELDPCVENIANISTNIQTIEHTCGHPPQQPCVRRNGNRCKFDFNTTLLSAPTPFAQQRAKFIQTLPR